MINMTGTGRIMIPTMPRVLFAEHADGGGAGNRVERATAGPSRAFAQLKIPLMVDVPGQHFRIMEGLVPVSLGRQLVAAGYEITGDNARLLQAELSMSVPRRVIFPEHDESNLGARPLRYLSPLDALALAAALGNKFRVQTIEELTTAHRLLGDQLFDCDDWELAIAGESHGKKNYKLYFRVDSGASYPVRPDERNNNSAVRLVEDI